MRTPRPDSATRVELLGAPLDLLDTATLLERIAAAIDEGRQVEQGFVNAAKICRLQHDTLLRDALHKNDFVTADGQAVVWAARLLGIPVPARVAGIDLFEQLLDLAEQRGYSVYLLGATQDVLDRVCEVVRRRHPRLELAGARNGYWRTEDEDAVVDEIAACTPDMLFVALDTPRKEIFLDRHRARLGASLLMGVGGSFDVVAGRRRRAPAWARRAGLEWLFRLLQEPRRLARRYLVGNTHFIWLVLRARLRGRQPPRRAIMFVGPSLHDRGGVASVMDVLARNPAPGFRVVSVASTGGPTKSAKVATTAAGLARAATLLASGRIALVHIHASSYWSFRRKLLFFALARLFGRPVVWQIHCGRFEEYVGSLRPLERRVVVHALTRARRVVFLSHAAERAVAARLGLTNTTVAPHPSPASVHEPSPEPLVVAFGTVGEAKGSFTLLRAFAEVVRRVPHARLVLAGDGARDAARAEAARLGVEQHVELPGWLDGEAKERLLARAAVLAHPSRVDALPMAVVEALSAGRPVVATSVGAIPEIVHDGVAGFIVPPDDPRALAAAIAQVLEDPELHARMCAAAAEAAAAFRPETVAAKFAEVYAAS